MALPDHIEGIGSPKELLKLVSGATTSGVNLSAQEGFVLSRIDGTLTTAALCQISGLGEGPTLDIVRRLRGLGLMVVGNEAPQTPPAVSKTESRSTGASAKKQVLGFPGTDADAGEETDEDASVDIKPETQVRIRRLHANLGQVSYFDILGVQLDIDKRGVRKAYFDRSKEFHPDRYYGRKSLGRYGVMLEEIFKHIAEAYRYLSNDKQRADYAQLLKGGGGRSTRTTNSAAIIAPPRTGQSPRVSRTSTAHRRSTQQTLKRVEPVHSQTIESSASAESGETRKKRASGEYAVNQRIVERVNLRAARAAGPIAVPPAEDSAVKKARPQRSGFRSGGTRKSPRDGSRWGNDADGLEAMFAKLKRAKSGGATSSGYDGQQAQRSGTTHSEAEQFYAQGIKQLQEGKPLAAAASFRLAMKQSPSDPRYQKAYEDAQKGTQMRSAANLYSKALAEEAQGSQSAADVFYMQAADAAPEGRFLRAAAAAALRSGDLSRALEYGKNAVKSDAYSSEARVVLAQTYIRLGKTNEARAALSEALKLEPEHQGAASLLGGLK